MDFFDRKVPNYVIYNQLLSLKEEGKLERYLENVRMSNYEDLLEIVRIRDLLLSWKDEDTLPLFRDIISYPHDSETMETLLSELLEGSDLGNLEIVRKFVGKDPYPGYNLISLLEKALDMYTTSQEGRDFVNDWIEELISIAKSYLNE